MAVAAVAVAVAAIACLFFCKIDIVLKIELACSTMVPSVGAMKKHDCADPIMNKAVAAYAILLPLHNAILGGIAKSSQSK